MALAADIRIAAHNALHGPYGDPSGHHPRCRRHPAPAAPGGQGQGQAMTEYDYWKIFPRMPKKVTIGDITVRDGFQHLEKFISTRAKIFYLES
jgi:hypothetical protein